MENPIAIPHIPCMIPPSHYFRTCNICAGSLFFLLPFLRARTGRIDREFSGRIQRQEYGK
jgi:hypothetical protein